MKNLMKFFKTKSREIGKIKLVPVETTIPDAKEALELTKEPQLQRCIEQINEAIKSGRTMTYVGEGEEKLHQETIDYILGMHYDIQVDCFKKTPDDHFRRSDQYFNKVFWHEGTTGKYTYIEK